MKERPIIFSAPMVRAILDGRKTQTRRVMKPQPHCPSVFEAGPGHFAPAGADWGGDGWHCPYGQPGDRLEIWEDREPPHLVGYGEVVSVRVERLQDISEEDAAAELGLEEIATGVWTGLDGKWPDTRDPLADFCELWDTIAKPGAKWDDNPFVWCVEFRRVTP